MPESVPVPMPVTRRASRAASAVLESASTAALASFAALASAAALAFASRAAFASAAAAALAAASAAFEMASEHVGQNHCPSAGRNGE